MKLKNTDLTIIRFFYELNKTELAEKLGVTKGYITQIDKGEKPLTEAIEDRIFKAFNIDEDTLIFIKLLAFKLEQMQLDGRINLERLHADN